MYGALLYMNVLDGLLLSLWYIFSFSNEPRFGCPARGPGTTRKVTNRAKTPTGRWVHRLSDRFSSMTVFCYSYQMISQKFSKNQDNFLTAIFIYSINYRIVGEVVLLKSKRDGFLTNGSFAPISAYILVILQFLYRKVISIKSRGIDLDMNEVIKKINLVLLFL